MRSLKIMICLGGLAVPPSAHASLQPFHGVAEHTVGLNLACSAVTDTRLRHWVADELKREGFHIHPHFHQQPMGRVSAVLRLLGRYQLASRLEQQLHQAHQHCMAAH